MVIPIVAGRAFDDRDVTQKRGPRERRTPAHLRRRVHGELALQDPRRRPRDRRERDVDLPAPLALRVLERHRRHRHDAE